jgi:hypothetical protein
MSCMVKPCFSRLAGASAIETRRAETGRVPCEDWLRAQHESAATDARPGRRPYHHQQPSPTLDTKADFA